MKLSPIQQDIYLGKICPYCKAKTKLVSEEVIFGRLYGTNKMFVCCNNYPKCNSYVGTDNHHVAKGRLAGHNLRKKKKRLTDIIYRITHNKYETKDELYNQIAEYLGIPRQYVSPDLFNIDTCEQAYTFCGTILSEHLKESGYGCLLGIRKRA